MTKKRNTEDISGSTFADLYDVQEEMNRRGAKPMGRPKNKIIRTPTTIYFTREETIMLRKLHLVVSEHVSVNKSQIVGLALELMSELVSAHNEGDVLFDNTHSFDSLKRKLKEFIVL